MKFLFTSFWSRSLCAQHEAMGIMYFAICYLTICIFYFPKLAFFQSIIICCGKISFIIWQLEWSLLHCEFNSTIPLITWMVRCLFIYRLLSSEMLSLWSNLGMKSLCLAIRKPGGLRPKLNQRPTLHVLYHKLHAFCQGLGLIYYLTLLRI